MRGPRLAAVIVAAYLALVALAYAVGGRPENCSAGGFGTVRTAAGSVAGFRVLIGGHPPRGALSYVETGPVHPVRLSATNPGSLTCGAGGATVTVAGTGVLGAGRTVSYHAEIRSGAGGAAGTFRIRLSSGYDSGARSITAGALHISSGSTSVSQRYP